MNRRIGRFSVSDEIKDSAAVRAVLDRCDVVEIAANLPYLRMDYLAVSPDFEPVDTDGEIPWYDWMIRPLPDGSSAVEAVRRRFDPAMSARIGRLREGHFD